jgi:Zn-dependent protease with chaperone function
VIAGSLYLICLAVELIPAFVRFAAAAVAATALGYDIDTTALIAVAVATLPLVESLATLVFGLPGGWGVYLELGARRPSNRERAVVTSALEDLKQRGARRPLIWFVVDDPIANAQTLGRTMYIHSGLIGHPAFEAVLAHECGHLGTFRGDLLLALIRLEFPGLRALRVYFETIGAEACGRIVRVLSGGASWQLPILHSLWQAYFRRSEHRADRYAKRLGYAHELSDYIDVYERPLDSAAPFRRNRSHPYAEQRIGRLLE